MAQQQFILVIITPTLRGFICNSDFKNKITKRKIIAKYFVEILFLEMITVRNDTKILSGHQNDVKYV